MKTLLPLSLLFAFATNVHAQMSVELTPSVYYEDYNVSRYGASDGSIEADVNGGIAPFSFEWSTGDSTALVSGLEAGEYMLVVTDSLGHIDTAEVTLTQPSALGATVSPQDVTCAGLADGQAMLYPSGSVGPYRFLWDTGDIGDTLLSVTGLEAGLHTVAVMAAYGDSISVEFTVDGPEALALALEAAEVAEGYHAACAGDSVQLDLSVSGGTGSYSFLWEHGSFSQNPKVTEGGWKRVRVTDASGCEAEDSILVAVPEEPLMPVLEPFLYPDGQAFSCDTCNDGMLILEEMSGGQAPYSILWSDGTTGDTLFGIHADSLITLAITDALGCEFSTEGSLPRGDLANQGDGVDIEISHYAGGYNVSCYGCTDGWVQVHIYGGQPPYTLLWADGDTSRYRTGMGAGTYSVTVSESGGQSGTREVVLVGPGNELIVQIADNSTACNGTVGGVLNGMVLGGIPPYTYIWTQDGDTLTNIWSWQNLSADGAYILAVMDATGQVARDSVTVGGTPYLTAQATAVAQHGEAHVGCTVHDGQIEVTIAGGVPPYHIKATRAKLHTDGPGLPADVDTTISDTLVLLEGLAAGIYAVRVQDAHVCTQDFSVELHSPERFPVFATAEDSEGGNDSTLTVNATTLGTTGEVEYSWMLVPAQQATTRIKGASLSQSEGTTPPPTPPPGGGELPAPWVGSGPQLTGVVPETLYMVVARDELGCMGMAKFSMEKPVQARRPAWGLHGNDSAGVELVGEGAPWLGTGDSTDMVLKANGEERIRLRANGNIAVKDTLLTEHLRVTGSTSIDSLRSRHIRADRITSYTPGDSLIFFGDSSVLVNHLYPHIFAYHHFKVQIGQIGGYAQDLKIQCQQLPSMGQDAGSNHTYFNTYRGSVGIGLGGQFGIPTEKLHVAGNVRITGSKLHVAQNGNVGIGTSNPQARFDVRDEAGDPALRIFNDGKVGIGISSNHTFGDGRLEVNGAIRSKKSIVEIDGWSDFVFDPLYRLPSLKQVETHIKEHGHLPSIPCAQDIEAMGLDVGQMLKLQMQKIEEMTLYIIELEKRLSCIESSSH